MVSSLFPARRCLHFLMITIFLCTCSASSFAQYLKVQGTKIVDPSGKNVLLRGMGLGGWMLQEGYMMRVQGEGQQHKIRERIRTLIGAERTDEFYKQWLLNHTTKADIDSMKAWGFNSVRLPMHFNLYTLPIEQEPVKGQNTWLETGFTLTDSLLSWCQANEMYLILDLHAAPGGQGNDLNISDRNPELPSLWESQLNQDKMIALWKKLAERYKGSPWLGAYDIINEPNWGFTDPEDKNGLNEKENKPLRKLMLEVTNAIRSVDTAMIIIIEGNGWGNNYNGIFPLWDTNTVLSFHKYWNYNTQGSIQHFLDLRDKYNIPIWLGETGENSNVWFTDAIRLMEDNNIGWCWWPLKKMGLNNPIEIPINQGYQNLLDHWSGKSPKPDPDLSYAALMEIAANSNIKQANIKYDVIDAMFRQVYSNTTKPFRRHRINDTILAVDYDMGRNGAAYFDKDTTEYYISTGTDRTGWNMGRSYRNDGVDIYNTDSQGLYVGKIEDGEWLRYTVHSDEDAVVNISMAVGFPHKHSSISVFVNGEKAGKISAEHINDQWQNRRITNVNMNRGENSVLVFAEKGGFNFKSLNFTLN